jgi:ADP-ribose pyrophosphatase
MSAAFRRRTSSQPDGPWRTTDEHLVHRGRWFEVWRDAVIRPDGSPGSYDHVVAPDSATVLAIDDGERVVLTRQWIYTHGAAQWRLPSGRVEAEDRSALDGARRELAEETGVTAARWTSLGTVHGADAVTNHRDHVFLATELRDGPPGRLESGEADLRVHRVAWTEVLAMVLGGQLPHAASAYAVLRHAIDRCP